MKKPTAVQSATVQAVEMIVFIWLPAGLAG
jgi:hypothetical protein